MTADAPPLDRADPLAALHDLFGYPEFRPGQEEIVRSVLAGEDVLAIMPTGAGKSLCYQLPAMLLPGCTVVISPLIALMKDQIDSLPPALKLRSALFNSTVERGELDAATAELVAGRLKLVYVAPERLRQRAFLHALARANISRLVVDEAHCVSLWGHDFRPDYLFIPAVVEMLGSPPVLAMTATATRALQDELRQRFRRPLGIVNTGVLRPNLSFEVLTARNADEKLRRLVKLCEETRGPGIVYVSSRKNAEETARTLRTQRISARFYHAGMDSADRAATQDDFMRGRVRVIVATVAFGMGVDKRDVRFLVHLNPSRSLEAYAQESGRAGRDGKPARCILFWTTSDRTALARWARDDALSRELLQAVYRAVRQGANGRFAWWPAEHLSRVVATALGGEAGETDIRVALGALEQVGVLRRHCDLPETARLRLADGGNAASSPLDLFSSGIDGASYNDDDAELAALFGEYGDESGVFDPDDPPAARQVAKGRPTWVREDFGQPAILPGGTDNGAAKAERAARVSELAAALDIMPGERTTIAMLEVATALGCAASDVEERLLTEQDAGALSYQGLGRGLLIELLPHPPDLPARLRTLLEGHGQAQSDRSEEMRTYAMSWKCRAATIAHHFGVAHPGRCGNCDVCWGREKGAGSGERGAGGIDLEERPVVPLDRAPEDIIIECVRELPFPMGRRGVSRVLNGAISSAVQADRSRHFGALASLSIKTIEKEIDRLVEAGYLHRDDSEYRLISVTRTGEAKEPGAWPPPTPQPPPPLRRERGSQIRTGTGSGSGSIPRSLGIDAASLPLIEDAGLVEERFERLRAWRRREASEAGLPPYTIFHDSTLRLMAETRVRSVDELESLKGVGPAKLEKYGVAVVELLRMDEG
ncbi:MAG: RecQ family ATP-dependent DNA helicase [Chloroflexi bacterium]|nr:RecQ family ATP-dependent DNA helicase [Chloroflexota bacterium]